MQCTWARIPRVRASSSFRAEHLSILYLFHKYLWVASFIHATKLCSEHTVVNKTCLVPALMLLTVKGEEWNSSLAITPTCLKGGWVTVDFLLPLSPTNTQKHESSLISYRTIQEGTFSASVQSLINDTIHENKNLCHSCTCAHTHMKDRCLSLVCSPSQILGA